MPVDGDVTQLDETPWGYVPKIQPITEFFDNDNASRPVQDVGLDGLNDVQELTWDFLGQGSYLYQIDSVFGAGSGAFVNAQDDAAGDNFNYYLGDELNSANADILERYKNFNGPQGNSNTGTYNGSPTSGTNIPNKEDANRDQTLSKTESYYQYKISMRKEDLAVVGNNFITDIEVTQTPLLPDGTTKEARWIQFKIPVFAPQKKVGTINDFRSIRFMRMFLKDFDQNVVLRFATLDLVRGEWRRYRFSLDDVREDVPTDEDDETIFAVNAVNLEENATRTPIPYVLPPGIDRQTIFGSSSLIQENEQSLALYTCNLKDGDARAVFKNMQMDMRMYKRMKMFVHAEDGDANGDGRSLRDGDLTIFMRIGSDYNQNYYEYEIPLKVTGWDDHNGDPSKIWPQANEFDIPFEVFKTVKLERDRINFPSLARYTKLFGNEKVTVTGFPNVGNVRTMMIGVRNPKKIDGSGLDDGLPKCAEIWVNELRLTDFDQRGGWAANARVTAKMADFADVSLSANMSTVGFGGIDQSVSERNKFEQFAYDFQSRWELGNFFSQQSGVKVPLFFSYSEDWKNPQFNPLDPDIEFDRALDNLQSAEEQTDLKNASQDYTQRKNINLTNVRKERRGGGSKKPKFYDIENFAVSYSFSETFRRNINVKGDSRKDHRGSLNYNYQNRPKNVQPFKSVKSKYLGWVRDFNFYYLPNKFTFRTELNRTNADLQMRNTAFPNDPVYSLPRTYNKSFTFNRIYSLGYDLAKSIKIDYNARMNTRIDEADGRADTPENRDTILWGLSNFGRPTQYHQTLRVTWQIPINKFPFLDFVTASLNYTGNYDWSANSTQAQDPNNSEIYFGNTIQNSAALQSNVNLNLITLYNNVPYLKRLNQGGGRNKFQARQPQSRVAQNENPDEQEKKKRKERNTKDPGCWGTLPNDDP